MPLESGYLGTRRIRHSSTTNRGQEMAVVSVR